MSHLCATPGCGKPAGLQCPTCVKLGLPPTYFCEQACFKRAWSQHKAVHDKPAASPAAAATDIIADVSRLLAQTSAGLTPAGRKRVLPGQVSPMRPVPPQIERPDYAVTGKPISEIRERGSFVIPVHSATEVEIMAKVGRLGREILDIAHRAIRVGVTTDEIDRIVHEACLERDCYPSPLNYNHFPKSCCTSVNEVICHGIPDSRPLEDGDIVNVDISVYKWGFHTDLNETFLVGNVDASGRKLVRTAYECLMKAIELVKPGTQYRDVGNVIEAHAKANGFSVVRSYCGHGIGRLFHGDPSIPHYSKNKAIGIMRPGHVFTIEPMINEGDWRDQIWPDDWTVVTQDLSRSAQFEHTLLVTETGCRVLTARLDESPPLEFLSP